MTRTEQKDMAELGLDENALAERQAKMEALTRDNSVRTPIPQECNACAKRIVRTGKNRLSDCGHMRLSHGEWAPKDERTHKAPKATAEADELMALLHTVIETEHDLAIATGLRDAARKALHDYVYAQGK